VGGGIIGCSVAYELGRRGAAVRVLECRDVGAGATQASAGILAPFIEATPDSPLYILGRHSLNLYDQFVANVIHDGEADVPYQRSGTLEVATDEESASRLGQTALVLGRAGIECRLLDRVSARTHEPHLADSVHGALIVPDHGFVGARALTAALRTAAARHRVSFDTSRTVRRVFRDHGGLSVETSEGLVTSQQVVLAAGSWAGCIDVEGEMALPVRPVRGQLLRLRWSGAPLARVVWGPRCYVVPWPDGSLLVGATVEDVGFDESATVAGVAGLLDAVTGLLPAARQAGFESVRVGLRPVTLDNLPAVGRAVSMPNLVYATGHYRNGVLLAPLTAALVAELLLNGTENPLLASVAPGRFEES